jgi:predicted nucleic acid-binding protein
MVLVDNNVLSSLAKIDRLGLLNRVFEEVGTTPSVLDELHKDEVTGYEFVARIDEVKSYEGGWLRIVSPAEQEVELTEEVLDASLSYTDAECMAIAESRGKRLLTDDGHVGEIASQRGVEVWDLKLLLEACIVKDLVENEAELAGLIESLREQDSYQFSEEDKDDLYDRL